MTTTIRQTLAMIREEKLYSAMYIAGTALAIAFVMLIAEVYYVKMADIAPEVNRSKTYYLQALGLDEAGGAARGIMTEDLPLFQSMKTPECQTVIGWSFSETPIFITLADGIHDRQSSIKLTDPAFFRLYQFQFIEGAPFSQNDFDSHRRVVVISDEIAEKVFGKDVKAVGKTIHFCHADYRVCGVVKKPSSLMEMCVADVWAPYTAETLTEEMGLGKIEYSNIEIYFNVPSNKDEAFMKELKEVEARYNAVHKDDQVNMTTFLYSHNKGVWSSIGFMLGDSRRTIWYVLPAILLLLLVPALNLSGMVASRMDRRLPEMAIRKAFGAKRPTLLGQVITENLILTLIGGAFGLCMAWTALYAWRDWVFHVFSAGTTIYDSVPVIQGEMLFSPAIFLISLLVCGLLNVLAAALPAWLSLRKPIVESMGLKK